MICVRASPFIAVPDLFKDRMLPEVVNVPVGAAGLLHVMREPGADASGAERTADITGPQEYVTGSSV